MHFPEPFVVRVVVVVAIFFNSFFSITHVFRRFYTPFVPPAERVDAKRGEPRVPVRR